MVIGMIGAENSHAAHFLNVINKKKLYEDVYAGYIYGGDDPETSNKLSEQYNLEQCPDEEAVIEKSDAIVITYRKGSLHYSAAMKALRASKPVFVDKPFTVDEKEAQEIIEYAGEHGLLISGGSSVKELSDVKDVSNKIKPGDTVVISFTADPKSEYDGYFFYGIHCVEVCLTLFGLEYDSVSAVRNGDTVISTIAYPQNTCIIITTPEIAALDVVVYGKNETKHYPIVMDYQDIGPKDFIEMINTGKMPRDYSFYSTSVKLMNEIIKDAGL